MPTDTQAFDLALILTAAGATVAATIIASIIELAKKLPYIGTWIDAKREPGSAVLLSALLTALAYFATVTVPDAFNAFAAFLAFLGIAGLATKAYDVGVSVKATVTTSDGGG